MQKVKSRKSVKNTDYYKGAAMKNWKFIKTENEAVGPNWDKKRQLEDELRGWMTSAQKLTGEEKANAEKQIAEIRKELNDVKIKIAHGENKKAGNENVKETNISGKNGSGVITRMNNLYFAAYNLSSGEKGIEKFPTESQAISFLKQKTGNESIEKQEWSMFKGLAKDAEKEVGNADLPTEQDLKNWIRMMEQDKKEAQREMDKWKHHTEGQYSGDQFNTAMVKYNEAVSQIKKMQEELRQGKYKKVGNESIGDEYNAEIYRLEKKKMDLERMGQGQKAREIEKQIQQLQKELREYDIGNKKTGNETAEEKKFGKVMREFDRGELKSSSGETVTNPEQAKAIAYSESEKVDNLKRARNKMAK